MPSLRFTLLLLTTATVHAAEPRNFLFTQSDELRSIVRLIDRPDIEGVQIVYSWKSLETAQDQYDFSQLETDLAFLSSHRKKLFAQIQDRFFEIGARNVPRYLLDEPEYGG